MKTKSEPGTYRRSASSGKSLRTPKTLKHSPAQERRG
jgi:hypothetical protein